MKKINTQLRFSSINLIIYIAGIILLTTLFKIQVIDGLSYREKSNTRLSKEVVIEPTRRKYFR